MRQGHWIWTALEKQRLLKNFIVFPDVPPSHKQWKLSNHADSHFKERTCQHVGAGRSLEGGRFRGCWTGCPLAGKERDQTADSHVHRQSCFPLDLCVLCLIPACFDIRSLTYFLVPGHNWRKGHMCIEREMIFKHFYCFLCQIEWI